MVHKEPSHMNYNICASGETLANVQNYAFKENWKSTQ